MKTRKKHYILLNIILFLYIYVPPIFQFNILHIISIFAYIVLVFKYTNKFLNFVKDKSIRRLIIGILCSLILLTTTITLTTQNYIQLYSFSIIILELLPCSILFTFLFEKYQYELDDILKVLLNVGLLQSGIAIIMFINPTLKNFIVNNFYSHYNSGTMEYWIKYRVYGLSGGLMYAMPVVQGFIAIIALEFSVRKSLKYLIYIPLLLLSAVINARTGIIVFILGTIVLLTLNINKISFKKIIRIIILLIVIIKVTTITFGYIENTSSVTMDWIKDGYYETKALFSGDMTGYYNAVSNMFFLPDYSTLITGSGDMPYINNYMGKKSDIGYINDIFLGGIFFTILLYSSLLLYFKSGRRKKCWASRYLTILMPIIMLVVNIKGFAFKQNEFVNLFIFISTLLIYKKSNTKKLAENKK